MSISLTFTDVCNELRAVLDDLVDALGKTQITLADNEVLVGCSFTVSLHPDKLLSMLEPERVRRWFDVLGSALTMIVSIEDFDYDSPTVSDSTFDAVIESVRTFVAGHEVRSVEVTVSIDKNPIRSKVNNLLGTNLSAMFFNESALMRRLSLKGVNALYDDGVLSANNRTTIAILNSKGLLQGPLLTIIGLSDATAGDILHSEGAEEVLSNWRSTLKLRQGTSTWVGSLSSIPPDLFLIGRLRPGLEAVFTALTSLCNRLSLLQFCESVVETNNRYVARIYRRDGPEFEVSVEEVARSTNISASTGIAPLYSLYSWALPSETRSRLDVVRKVIHEISQRTPDMSMGRLEELGQQLIEAAQATYEILSHEAFTTYLQLRKEAEAAIATHVELTRKNISTLGEDLLNTVLQFVAGALAFTIANDLRQDVSPALRTAGLIIGLVYIVLIWIFRLARNYHQYLMHVRESNATINRFLELPLTLREAFAQTLTKSFQEFRLWLCLCSLAYTLGFVVLLVLLMTSSGH